MKKYLVQNRGGFRAALIKALLVMKLIVLLLLLNVCQVMAKARAQEKISLNLQQVEIGKVFNTIERQGFYRFLFNSELQGLHRKVNINVDKAGIAEVLSMVLSGTDLTYKMLDDNLIVVRLNSLEMQDIRITGKVTNESGEPLVGVSITVKGSSTGTITDNLGNFELTVPENAVLEISYVGFISQEIPVNNQSVINISLIASAKQLDQVIIVGYGTQRKIDVTGSVSQIKGDEISKQPAANPISSLQGKIAGVQITNSGAPGSSPEIRIRGIGTLYGDQSPLYVVDGVWYDDISFLNPADIDNLSILKDASSESIYGIRAANGVVLISTRKGKAGQTTVNYNGYVGMQSVTNQIKMADGSEYATAINELRGNTNLDPAQFGKGTDWYHQILRNAFVTNHQVSVSGGSEKSTYNFSLGYYDQDGIVEKNNYKRYTARLQNDFVVFKPLKIGYSITAVASNSIDIPGSIFHELFSAAPIVPVYYQDGTYGDPSDFDLGDGANFNPQVSLDVFNQKSRNFRGTGNVFGDLKFAKHFTFHTSLGGDFGQAEYRYYLPEYTATLKQRNTLSNLTIGRTETRNWILENTLTYENRFNDHRIRVLLGQSAQQAKFYEITANAKGVPYSTEDDLYLRLGNSGSNTVSDGGDKERFGSYFGRVNYSFMNRYMLNFSLRADGASKFSGDKRWGYFPSIGAGWMLTDEPFLQDQKIFTNLKLRGSWGVVGNAKVPSNLPFVLVDNWPGYSVQFGNTIVTGANIDQQVPPITFWEKAQGTDIGIEGAMAKDRLNFEFDYYSKKTIDAIFAIPILGSLGTSSGTIVGNQANILNKGWEFSLTWKDNINKNLSYRISGNLGINDNEVTKTQTGKNPVYGGGGAATGGQLATRTVVGEPIGEFYGLQVGSVFQNDAEVAASPQAASAKPGDFRFVDQNKDGVIDGKDRIVLGNPNAKYIYGLNTTWNYKQFDLTVDFQGVAGVHIYNANLGIRYGTENFSKDFYDNRWHGQGTSTIYPSVNIGGGDNYKPNSFFVEDGSYLRVRNIQLGYTFGTPVLNSLFMKQLRVYVNAQNALNFFKYKGFSPEIGGSALDRGIDTNVYPLYATYNFGVNVTF